MDLTGSTMNYFIGCKALPELLTMGKVGIYVDMPQKRGPSLVDNQNIRPYVYLFALEDIRCWVNDDSNEPNEYASILLREQIQVHDEETGYPVDMQERFRRLWKNADGGISASFHYDGAAEMFDVEGNVILEPMNLDLQKIPFIILDIGESLMTDIADYQIAMLNLASSDMAYSLKSNFPFYIEQYNPLNDNQNARDGTAKTTKPDAARNQEVVVGAMKGRRYALGLDAPGYIHPSPEPLKASMEKQEQLKTEIRQLLKLAVSNIKPPKVELKVGLVT